MGIVVFILTIAFYWAMFIAAGKDSKKFRIDYDDEN